MAAMNFAKLHKEFKAILKKIKDYDRIAVYRHTQPDFDAFGSQMGLATWLKANFPSKDVIYVGETNDKWCPAIFPKPMDVADDWFARGPYLAITVDVANVARISGPGFDQSDYKVKIDHHPNVEPYGDLNVVYPNIVACAELVALFELAAPRRYKMTAEMARYLYCGMVGDSGRFLYPDTDDATLRIAASLIGKGVDIYGLYDKMYARSMSDMEAEKFVLNNTKFSPKGTAYYVLTDADLKRLGLTSVEGKLFVNLFRNVSGITATVSVTQDIANNCFRVSLRSNQKIVSKVAAKYRGGGHDFASGATINSLDELPWLIKDLDETPLVSEAK